MGRADAGWLGRWGWLVVIVAATMPALTLRFGLWHASVVVETAMFGLAVVAAAFTLTWTAEAAEHDISQALALAVLALIAVLPEYAVDLTFAWKAGHDPQFAAYAAANMTGGNRLLVGLGWSTVVFLFYLRTRGTLLVLARTHALELTFLGIATAYSFVIPFKETISLIDSAVLIALFLVYIVLAARHPSEEPELMGPAVSIGALPTGRRRLTLVGLFLFAAGMILASAEPFAAGLVHTGTELGIDEFLLVQWLAPLASEAPEFIAAGMMAWRGRASAGMATLISSKVNQWTLLIGGLPIAYALSKGDLSALPLDSRQVEEVFLTAAQSLFAVAILVGLVISLAEGAVLATLFMIQATLPTQTIHDVMSWVQLSGVADQLPEWLSDAPVRWVFSVLYLLLAAFMFWRHRDTLLRPLSARFGRRDRDKPPESADVPVRREAGSSEHR
jgi:cation:H+ antiporter